MSYLEINPTTNDATLIVESPKYGVFHIRIDSSVADRVSASNWTARVYSRQRDRVYFQTSIRKPDGTRSRTLLHRLIMNAPDGVLVDHIRANDTLDNRLSNLRVCSASNNMRNRRSSIGSSSIYKGVSWNKQHSKWVVTVTVKEGDSRYVGLRDNEVAAALLYDQYASRYHGEFALLNFPKLLEVAA